MDAEPFDVPSSQTIKSQIKLPETLQFGIVDMSLP